jgi:hypothetical protein
VHRDSIGDFEFLADPGVHLLQVKIDGTAERFKEKNRRYPATHINLHFLALNQTNSLTEYVKKIHSLT